MANRNLDAFSIALSVDNGPTTQDGSPSQGTQGQFDTALSDVNGAVNPDGGPPPNTAVAIHDLCIFLSTLLGSVADINNAIAEVNIVADTTASSMAQALSALAGFVGGS